MTNKSYTKKSSENQNLFYQSWQANGAQSANICIIHGYAEHSNRYQELAKFFTSKGWNVFAYDRVGHGQSGGKRGHVTSYDRFMEEVDLLLDLAHQEMPGLPTFLYGHSMGGNITLNFLLRNSPKIEGAIVTGSWIYLGDPPSNFLRGVIKVLAAIIPALSIPTKLDPKLISKDPAEVKKYMEDPKVFTTITLKTGLEMLKASDFLKQPHHSKIPLLVMHGADDQVCLPKGSEEFVRNFEGDIQYIKWPGRYHEIHNEYNREEVYAKVADWISSKI